MGPALRVLLLIIISNAYSLPQMVRTLEKQHRSSPASPQRPRLSRSANRRLQNAVTILYATGTTRIGQMAIRADDAVSLTQVPATALLRGAARME